jgi:hypothetical protein
MTRICRAQFEADDILESQIICGQERDTSDRSESRVESEGADQTSDTPMATSPSGFSVFTWRLPDWVNFSYSPVRHRIHPPVQRPPNPFAPRRSAFSRLNSISLSPSGIGRQNVDATAAPQGDNAQDHQQSQRTPGDIVDTPAARKSNVPELQGPVVPHPPPVPWDDQWNRDLPYDNPYYTHAISNTLWLPRNPFGILDLDDTVDLRTSLTTDPQTGQLGTWFGYPDKASPRPTSLASNASENLPRVPLRRQYTGTEEIGLPLAIARRVQALENEDGVEQTSPRRPSIFSARRPSSGEKVLIRRPSDTTVTSRSLNRARSSPILSASETPRIHYSIPVEPEPAAQPEVRAQVDFINPSRPFAIASGSRLSLPPQPLSRAQTLTTQEAVTGEVVAEEEAALEDQLKEEQEEAEKGSRSKNHWLTSWMFSKER